MNDISKNTQKRKNPENSASKPTFKHTSARYTAREAALISLCRINADKRYSNLELDAAIKKYGLEGSEKKLYTILVYGTIERQLTLDFVIDGLLDEKHGRLDENLRVLLRMGAFQLLCTDRIPVSAAVNESVELCKKSASLGIKPSLAPASGLANAILRGIVRQKRDMSFADYIDGLVKGRGLDGISALSVKYSVNSGLIKLWADAYGTEKTEAILSSPMRNFTALRVNTLVTTPKELCARFNFEKEGCAELSPLSEVGVRFSGASEFMLAAIEKGLCFVEDESSQLTSALLSAKPGESVLDCCSAPGGKTFSVGLHMANTGRILACDLHKNKLNLVKNGAERLGLTIVETMEADGSVHSDEIAAVGFDRVLCDVPCSGSGVIFKKPELRFKDPSEYERLPELQYRILSNAADYLKPGGTLVYSTCTLNPAENEEVVRRFAAENQSFRLESMRTFFPDTDGTDGFFGARLVREMR